METKVLGDTLRLMVLFAAVVEAGSLTGAARRLGVTRSAVSRGLGRLEEGLGVRLMNRTTRKLALTEEGQVYYQGCARVVEEAESADRAVRSLSEQPAGTLRINGAVILERILVPVIDAYLSAYPGVSVDLTLDDHYVDLLAEGVDLAVRIGHPKDSSLIARKLAPVRQVVCGSPAYLERHGTPAHPAQLTGHNWIVFSLLAAPDRLTFERDGERVPVKLTGRLRANGGPAIRAMLLHHMGLTLMPELYVHEELGDGRLVTVLDRYEVKRSALYAVYPHRDHLSPRVRLMVDLLADRVPGLMGEARGGGA